MSQINLNDAKFDAKDIKIFNDGKAGIVENVKLEVEKKSATQTNNTPDYKINYIDSVGSVNQGFYYIDPNDAKFDSKIKLQGTALKHILSTLHFNMEMPKLNFSTTKEMLDNMMSLITKAAANNPVRLAVCYGTTLYPSDYLRVKTFPPFMESMAIALSDSKLTLGRNDLQFKIEKDNNTTEDFNVSSLKLESNTESVSNDFLSDLETSEESAF